MLEHVADAIAIVAASAIGEHAGQQLLECRALATFARVVSRFLRSTSDFSTTLAQKPTLVVTTMTHAVNVKPEQIQCVGDLEVLVLFWNKHVSRHSDFFLWPYLHYLTHLRLSVESSIGPLSVASTQRAENHHGDRNRTPNDHINGTKQILDYWTRRMSIEVMPDFAQRKKRNYSSVSQREVATRATGVARVADALPPRESVQNSSVFTPGSSPALSAGPSLASQGKRARR